MNESWCPCCVTVEKDDWLTEVLTGLTGSSWTTRLPHLWFCYLLPSPQVLLHTFHWFSPHSSGKPSFTPRAPSFVSPYIPERPNGSSLFPPSWYLTCLSNCQFLGPLFQLCYTFRKTSLGFTRLSTESGMWQAPGGPKDKLISFYFSMFQESHVTFRWMIQLVYFITSPSWLRVHIL